MKTTIKWVFVVLIGLAVYGCAGKPSGPAKPEFDTIEFDFGKIPQGATVSHIYQLTNLGGDSIVVQNVRTNCGCTKAPIEKTVAYAGETIPIELRFNSRGYRGKSTKSANVNLFIEEQNTPAFRLSFSTFTDTTSTPFETGELGASPYKIEFNDSLEYVDITLTNFVAAKREIRVVDYQPERVKLAWTKKSIAPKGEEILRVTRIADAKGIVASITLEMTDHPNTRITIPISEYVAQGSVRTGRSVSRPVNPPSEKTPWQPDK
jgi:hypothetical protein